jgi:signal transduction histidine kinase
LRSIEEKNTVSRLEASWQPLLDDTVARRHALVSHDLRKPVLQAVRLLEMMAAAENATEAQAFARRWVPHLRGEALKVEALLREMINPPPAVTDALIDVSKITGEVLARYASAVSAKQVTLKVEIAHTRGVAGDSLRFSRALDNLVDNAVAAMAPKSLLRIASNDVLGFDRRRHAVQIVVANTGSHIDEADYERIFEPYYTKGKLGGTGLGLAIVREAVQELGGVVTCRSCPASGVRFVIDLPSA